MEASEHDDDDCCVCAAPLINNNVTACCKQRIHKTCLVKCLNGYARACPFCRFKPEMTPMNKEYDVGMFAPLWTCAHEPDPQTAQCSCQCIGRMQNIVIFFICFKTGGVGFMCTGP